MPFSWEYVPEYQIAGPRKGETIYTYKYVWKSNNTDTSEPILANAREHWNNLNLGEKLGWIGGTGTVALMLTLLLI
jgi:hypothetical protein